MSFKGGGFEVDASQLAKRVAASAESWTCRGLIESSHTQQPQLAVAQSMS